MGWAREAAERIAQIEKRQATAAEQAAQVSASVDRNWEDLWETLVQCVQIEVSEFVEFVPSARNLIAERVNENNLTVRTTAQPLIRLEIVVTPGSHVQAYVEEAPSPFSTGRSSKTPKFRFGVDRDYQICFANSDGAVLHATQVTVRLLEPLGRFFEPRAVRTA